MHFFRKLLQVSEKNLRELKNKCRHYLQKESLLLVLSSCSYRWRRLGRRKLTFFSAIILCQIIFRKKVLTTLVVSRLKPKQTLNIKYLLRFSTGLSTKQFDFRVT